MSKATVHVHVELDIEISDSWGDDCTLGQVRQQAYDAARHIIVTQLAPALEPLMRVGCTGIKLGAINVPLAKVES